MTKNIIIKFLLLIIVGLCAIVFFYRSALTATTPRMALPNDTAALKSLKPTAKLITVLTFSNDFVYGYEATLDNGKKLRYENIGEYLQDIKKTTDSTTLFVVIRHMPDIRYDRIKTILDEMSINNIRNYTMAEALPAEQKFIENNR